MCIPVLTKKSILQNFQTHRRIYLVNGIQHIHAEGTFIVIFLLLGPFLGLRVEKVLTPKPEKLRFTSSNTVPTSAE